MAEVPDHLLQRSRERRKALGLPVPGEEGGDEAPVAADAAPPAGGGGGGDLPPTGGGGDAGPPADDGGGDAGGGDTGGIPAHLLERSKRRRAALSGDAAPAAAAAGGGGTATAVAAPPAPTATGPGGHTQRLLTVVKSGSIQQTRAEAQDKVHVWPHLLVIELASILILLAAVTVFSALVRAPLLSLSDFNKTPNPSKAPWYFLGLQELLTMFHPMVAGVTIPGVGLGLLALAPFIDKNPSHKPKDRKFAIAIFTMFIMMWSVLVIIGSFFRGKGFNFVFPWNDGIFFEL
ncbi:MAG: menaquinol-cytochrome c reductase cytochrome b subunit [Acidimicrobiia bacterium]|nr:menaquinol-cytochrome c reductase cytochrome b subunit [Acidimicrobiia bacterium]